MDYDTDVEIERMDTLLRILYSLLFAVAVSVLETVVLVLVSFQLVYTLITKSEPPDRVTDAGNRVTAYFYRVLRWLTHNEVEKPFPFSDFPEAVEPPIQIEAKSSERVSSD